MTTQTQEIILNESNTGFTFDGNYYNCSYIIERDKKLILQEADISHPENIEKLYVRESLSPRKVHIYLGEAGDPVAIMIIYTIDYKNKGEGSRLACGDYYIIEIHDDSSKILLPHFYQASICW
jgi:hypothetical protein